MEFVCLSAAKLLVPDRMLQHMHHKHGAAGRQLWWQIVGTTAFVFVTFLLRAVFSIIYALVNVLQNIVDRPSTDNPCDASCFKVFALMQAWLEFTPSSS